MVQYITSTQQQQPTNGYGQDHMLLQLVAIDFANNVSGDGRPS